MFRPNSVSPHRRGVILVLVLSLLTLFALVGLSFVLYADAVAKAAQLHRESECSSRPDADPELLFSYFLGQFIYDVPDDESGVYSALRGHSLARNMYGYNGGTPSFSRSQSPAPVLPFNSQPAANIVPFNGTGRLRAPSPFGPYVDDYQLINYTYHPEDTQLPPAQRFLRDPERLGWRPASLAAPRGVYTGGFNAPYTYPDLNSTFLAAVRADGTVLLPSFYRPWTAIPPTAGEFYQRDTGRLNPWWSPTATPPPWFKYTTLRPLPALNPGFPPPEDGGGDVKNLIAGPGTFRRLNGNTPEYWNNDSFWMDLGFPVLTTPDGRKYKPLFAALVADLDNRVNVNVHGNILGKDFGHASNQGWGPWEVNLSKVLSRDPKEAAQLLRGTVMKAPPLLIGRYGPDAEPTSWYAGNQAPRGMRPHFHSQVDFDGRDENAAGAPSAGVELPTPRAFESDLLKWYPTFGNGYGNGSGAERTNHPLLFNYFQPPFLDRPQNYDRTFRLSNMEALLRYRDTNSPALTSELFRLCPTNLNDSRIRQLVTTHSFDVDRPGVSPWVDFGSTEPYQAAATTDPDEPARPQGAPIPFPSLTKRGTPPFDPRLDRGEFGGVDWRALGAALARVNLNRPLPPYPHQGRGRTPPFGPPLTTQDGQVTLDMPFNADAPNGPIWRQFLLAQEARQRLANALYRRLLVVTGVPPIRPEQHPHEPPAELLRTRRWLAQLAVNIVDFIDEDDISTPFCFYTAEDSPLKPPDPARVDDRKPEGLNGEIQWPLYWVFGTELPRIVVNEALAEIKENDPDRAYTDTIRVFVELHNTFPRSVPPGAHQPDSFPVPLKMEATGLSAAYTPYRLVIGVKGAVTGPPIGPPTLAAILPGVENDNVLGNPHFDPVHPEFHAVRKVTTDADFLEALATIGGGPQRPWKELPGSPPYRAVSSPYVPAHGPDDDALPQGFLLLGPPDAAPDPFFLTYDPFAKANQGGIPEPTPVLRTPSLQYDKGFEIRPGDPPDERTKGLTVVLRRLANPYLPFDGNRKLSDGQANPKYNPFVTVDYLENIPVQPVEVADGQPHIASQGKLQPYAAHRSQLREQTREPDPNPNHLAYSFGRENVPAPERYDWLTHLDRPLISPLELLHVSGYQPYQLTQRFITPDGNGLPTKFTHRAPWLGPSHRLYRLFEFLETGPQAAGVGAGGRIPGKININTVWDPEILRALCDAQPANHFTEGAVDRLFDRLIDDNPATNVLARTKGPGGTPSGKDRPFWGLAIGTYPSGDRQFPTGGGPDDSFLRLLRLQPPFESAHPYLDSELLTKVLSHLTPRSNVFAVWLTVGFFEVADDSTRPVKLGAEVGRAENRHIRHRMFAILDRTNLSIASCVASLAQPVVPPPPPPHPAPVPPLTVSMSALSGTTQLPLAGPSIPWGIQAGTTLVVDTGANQEAVEVLAVNSRAEPPTVTAVFTKPHAAGTAISLANTPGAPPIFLKPVSVTGPDPLPHRPSIPQMPDPITVTVAVDPGRSNATTLAGKYDGVPWKIQQGAKLILDVGPDQEVVTVQTAPFALDPGTATGSFQLIVSKPHAGDFLITNTLLGNPGPRPRFNPRDPAFYAVVRYLSIIQ